MNQNTPGQPNARSMSFKRKIWQALTLDSQFYQTARGEKRTLRLALMVVVLAASSRAIANILISLLNRATPLGLVITALLGIFTVIVCYYFWTFTIWKIGQWLKCEVPDYKELLCPVGFAYAPQLLMFITIIPVIGRAIELLLSVWTLYAVILAVSEAMHITKLRAALISLVSFPVVQIVPILIQVIAQQFA